MSEAPLVSVLVPTFNYGRFLPRCIDSILAQTYRRIELIICDNQSTDDTQEVLSAYVHDPRVRVYLNESNLGMFGNSARYAEHARGDYLKWVDADDWLHAEYVAETVQALDKEPSAIFVSVMSETLDSAHRVVSTSEAPGGPAEFFTREQAMEMVTWHVNPIGNPSQFIVRADAYHEVHGYNPDVRYCGDDLPPRVVPHPMLVPAPVEGREGRASSGTRATA